MVETALNRSLLGELSNSMKTLAKVLGIGFVIAILLVCVGIFLLHPYRLAEELAADIFERYAPAGTTVNGISVSFPFNIVLTNLTVPIQVQDQQQQLVVKRASGKVSILSLLQGTVDVGMNADFFGGTLWLDLQAEGAATNDPDTLPLIVFDARAREIDMVQLCTFFGSPVLISGVCNADAEGEVDENNLATLKGRALVIGQHMAIPPFPVKGFIIPENSGAGVSAKLSARDGKIHVERFRMNGSAYELAGKGEIVISDPPEQSPVYGSFSMVFHEAPVVVDENLDEAGAEEILGVLVEAGAEIYFRVTGTAGHPDVRVDAKSSLDSFLKQQQARP